MAGEWDGFEEVPQRAPARSQDEWAEFERVRPRRGRKTASARSVGPLRATGQVHDGDTFRLDTGGNARLYGADAFELGQTGASRGGELIRLGEQARAAFTPFAQPGAAIGATGSTTYGRPVVSVDNEGDAAASLLSQGMAIATPEYLRNDPGRMRAYMEAERLARLNRRGAWQTQFEQPASYRHGTPDPWAKAQPGTAADGEAVFWDEPLPSQGLRPEVAKGYVDVWQDMASTPDDLIAYAQANGFAIDPAQTRKSYEVRNRTRQADSNISYAAAPRVLTDLGDGATGAAARGVGDPLNLLDEAGALVDTLGGSGGRESVWNSDRRFGDILANNLDQNRSILASDDANHPYARFGGQLVGGLAIPGASVEGVGFGAARAVLQGGGSRFAAKLAARDAVVNRLGLVGAVQGGIAGAGAGETWQERAQGAAIGAPAGLALGVGTGMVGAKVAERFGRAGRRAASRADEAADDAGPVTPGNIANRPVGRFGPIHDDADYQEAFNRMAADDAGEMPAAIRHPEIGDIDLVWGNEGYGLSKIVSKHPEVVNDLPAIVERLPVRSRPEEVGNNRYVLEDDTHRAIIAPDFDGETKRWVVTAYEKRGNTPEGADISPRSLGPDGGSTGAGVADDVGGAVAPGNPSGAMEGPASPSTRIDPASDPLVTAPPTSARELPRDGNRGPLSAYAPVVWREMAFGNEGFGKLTLPSQFAGRWRNEGGTDLLQFADTPTMATGQGNNKGFLFEYDAAPFIGRPQFQKPGSPLAWRNGAGEYSTNGVTQETLQGALRGFKIKAGAVDDLKPTDRDVLGLITRDLERQGWSRLDADDGSTVYRRPDVGGAAEGQPATAARPAPLLDDATTAERAAQAERIQPGDVLPIPANTVASLEEAERITAGRMSPVRAPDERSALERRNVPNATTGTPIPKRGPLDLVTWLRSQGGIRAQGGELRRYGIDNAPRKGMDFSGGENRLGPLVSDEGMNYDDAAHAAWEAGFFPDMAEHPTIADFLDALNETHAGRNRAFRPDDLPEIDAFEAARQQRYRVESARNDGAPLYEDRSQPVGLDDLDDNSPPIAAYEEWGENAPDFAGNIRLGGLDSPEAIKRALVQTDRVAGGFDAARRGRITQAETKSLAEEMGMTADALLKRRKGQAFNAEEALAARQILARSATDLVRMAKRVSRVENPGDELEAAFRNAWLRHAAIQEQVAGMTAEAGRLLQQFRMTADSRDAQRVLASLGDSLGGVRRLKETAERIVDLERVGTTPAGINQFALRSLLPRWRDKVIELYINSLLSGPQTHAVNILSNTLTSMAQLPEHAIAAGVGAVRKTLPGQAATDRVLFSELGTRAAGMVAGAREGMRAAARSFKTGDAEDAVTKIEGQQMNAIGGRLGTAVRFPTRMLTAEDELFKGIARRMELNGSAMRRAVNEGLKGKAARERAADLVLNPDDAMLRGSFEYARYLTYQTPLRHGSFAAGISQATQGQPVAKLLLPFVRTPMNLLKFAVERSPAAVAMKSWRAEYAAGGARRDLALTRMLVGTGVGAAMYEMAQAGHITGGGPADRNARRLLQANGWQPYSLKIGDKYYSYARLDPFATTIGTVADFVDLQSHMTDKQQERSATLVAAAIANNLTSKTWLSGLSSALEAVNDPDRYMQNFLSRTAGAVAVPSIVAQIARTNDPIMREARGPLDRIRSRIPGMSDDLYPRRDVFGREVRQQDAVGPDIVSPLWTGTGRKDRTIDALIEAGATVTPPLRSHKVGGKAVPWTPAQYDQLQQITGGIAKPELDALIRTGTWARADEDARQKAVRDVMQDARKEAKARVLSPAPAGDEWAGFEAVR